jgi:8-oxo-dGTP pyrophosphatase MutT (NUDIX family)
MRTVYFNDKPLLLTRNLLQLENLNNKKEIIISEGEDQNTISGIIKAMQSSEIEKGFLFNENIELSLDAIKKQFTLIKAAGGFVHFNYTHILFIFRKGKWDLPKGKLDANESLEICAVREVKEETGIRQTELKIHLHTSYHTYYEKENHLLKETYWYLLESKQMEPLVPQRGESIEKCEWVDIENIASYLLNTHPSIFDVVIHGLAELNKNKQLI